MDVFPREPTVHQGTVDGLFDANELLYQRIKNKGSVVKGIDEFLSLKSTKDFIETIISKEPNSSRKIVVCVSNSEGNENIRIADFESVKKSKEKGMDVQPLQRYYFHPLLYMEFAMWISPTLKYDVLNKFVLDYQMDFVADMESSLAIG